MVLNHDPALLRSFLVNQTSHTLFSELVRRNYFYEYFHCIWSYKYRGILILIQQNEALLTWCCILEVKLQVLIRVVYFHYKVIFFLPFLEFYNFAPVINSHQSWLYLSYLVILRCEQTKRVHVRCHNGRKVYVSESCQLMLKESMKICTR